MRISVPFWLQKLHQLWRLVRESHAEPLVGDPQVPPAVEFGTSAITFIGHSSFLIQIAGRALLIDPVFATRLILLRRQRRPGVRIADLPPIDAVLLTHAHMDHLNLPSLRAVCRAMRTRRIRPPIAIVPNGVEDLVRNVGFSEVQSLNWWKSFRLTEPQRSLTCTSEPAAAGPAWDQAIFPFPRESAPAVTITAVPARHWGARMFNDTHRGFGGYVIETATGPSIYHSGDTAYFSGFAELRRRMQPEIALLPIGAYFPDSYRTVHTSPEEALRAFLDLGADAMIPMHYNTFRLGREPMSEPLPRLLRAAEGAGVRRQIFPLLEGETWIRRAVEGIDLGERTARN